jgi:hypothetical protein
VISTVSEYTVSRRVEQYSEQYSVRASSEVVSPVMRTVNEGQSIRDSE